MLMLTRYNASCPGKNGVQRGGNRPARPRLRGLIISRFQSLHNYKVYPDMEAIVKVISMFVALFVIANGAWVAFMPPFGDELVGLAIVAVGILIPVITFYVAKQGERRYC